MDIHLISVINTVTGNYTQKIGNIRTAAKSAVKIIMQTSMRKCNRPIKIFKENFLINLSKKNRKISPIASQNKEILLHPI